MTSESWRPRQELLLYLVLFVAALIDKAYGPPNAFLGHPAMHLHI